METRKQAIIAALHTFMNQRPGLASMGYENNWDCWRKETREITRHRCEARIMLRQIELSDSITADAMLAEGDRGGRLTIRETPAGKRVKGVFLPSPIPDAPKTVRVDYCAGQSYSHEYRAAVARYAASVLRAHVRENCMPAPGSRPCGHGSRVESEAGKYWDGKHWLSAGDWLRAHFRKEFGRVIASRWFD